MSPGTRYFNFREGDRSEYLAVYILSGLGLVTQVPRQEDIGFDLICNLAEQESGIQSFRHHYAVSVKSVSTPNILLAPPESKAEDPAYTSHYDWLFHLELPLMLGVVDKEKQELSLYSTLPAWFLYHEQRQECGIIELVPRTKVDGTNQDVGKPNDRGVDPKAGGRRRFEVDLGFPIMTITVADLKDVRLIAAKKPAIRRAVELGAASARFAQTQTPFFWWIHKTLPQGGVTEYAGYVRTPRDNPELQKMLSELAPGLLAAAFLFRNTNKPDWLNSIGATLRLLPTGSVPEQIKQALPEVFSPP